MSHGSEYTLLSQLDEEWQGQVHFYDVENKEIIIYGAPADHVNKCHWAKLHWYSSYLYDGADELRRLVIINVDFHTHP